MKSLLFAQASGVSIALSIVAFVSGMNVTGITLLIAAALAWLGARDERELENRKLMASLFKKCLSQAKGLETIPVPSDDQLKE